MLRGVLKPGAAIDQILAEVKRMGAHVEKTDKRSITQVRSVKVMPS